MIIITKCRSFRQHKLKTVITSRVFCLDKHSITLIDVNWLHKEFNWRHGHLTKCWLIYRQVWLIFSCPNTNLNKTKHIFARIDLITFKNINIFSFVHLKECQSKVDRFEYTCMYLCSFKRTPVYSDYSRNNRAGYGRLNTNIKVWGPIVKYFNLVLLCKWHV